MNSIQLGVSPHFINKPDNMTSVPARYKTDFPTATYNLDELTDHILDGGAFSVADVNGYRDSKHFVSSQLIGLDFDNNKSVDDLSNDPFIRDYAALIYATPNSCLHSDKNPNAEFRSRAIFILDKPITDTTTYTNYVKRLLLKYNQADQGTSGQSI